MNSIVTFGELMLRLTPPNYEVLLQTPRFEATFGGALIYSLRNFDDWQKIIDFAVGASALKHTIYGDFQRMSREDVEALIAGNGNGRIQR